MAERIRQFWNEQSQRERYLLAIGLILLLVCLFFYGILSPLLDYRSDQEQQMIRAERNLRWMQQNQGVLSQLESNQTEHRMKNSTLTEIIKETAQQNGIVNLNSVNSEPGMIELQLTDTRFNALLTWLQQLEQQYAIQVQSATLTESGKHDGMIGKTTLKLARKGA